MGTRDDVATLFVDRVKASIKLDQMIAFNILYVSWTYTLDISAIWRYI